MNKEKETLTIIVEIKNDKVFIIVRNGSGMNVFNKATGIDPQEMGFVFSDEVIPLRDMLELLGFDCREIVQCV